ncbi:ABC-2 transporter permease [Schaalia sp. 19OD2882]|uniref:ABC-2 transporter permease n=1 Tax=Schaalia sp. 19OD2882 TaxID=2794089 RepID=UPI001C1EAECE|nr:ABC-2 transporter permease [Schaalia sp. 19OD2882]QWW20105.1 ABC-2 transporter permease [Schaalia sp. 19OD2882]
MRLDISAHAPTLQTFAVVVLIFITMNIAVNGGEGIAYSPVIAATTTMFLPSRLFAIDERSNLTTLGEILPITRSRIVAGRHLLIALVAAASILFGLAVLFGGHALFPGEVDTPLRESLGGLAVALLVTCLVCGIQMPFLYALGHARTGMWALGATMVAIFGGVALLKQFPDAITSMTEIFATPWALPVCIAGALVVLALSAIVSTVLYRGRDL